VALGFDSRPALASDTITVLPRARQISTSRTAVRSAEPIAIGRWSVDGPASGGRPDAKREAKKIATGSG
jgi:hypothetical protein